MSVVKEAKQAAATPVQDNDLSQLKAQCSLSPIFNAACLAQAFSVQGDLDFGALVEGLRDRCKDVHDGDLKRAESMLIAQAHSLDTIFTNLARRGIGQEGLKQYEAHMKLALRAQSQCRATLETLAAIKNPPVVFVKQANFAQGHQQVNNNTHGPADVRELESRPNELLDHNHEQRLDTRTTATASGSDQAMEALESVDRTANVSGQERGEAQRMDGRGKASPSTGRESTT